MTPALALVDRLDVPRDRVHGGVEILNARLAEAARARGIDVVHDPDVGRVASLARERGVLVFSQQEGRLSPHYRDWAQGCLDAGALVVEKNVFALPSAHRPVHPRYVHALMSVDGAHRLAWRSGLAGCRPPAEYLLLPNPLLASASEMWEPRHRDSNRLRFLRAGRPDAVKWSDWEQRLAQAIARSRPGLSIELTLVGLPDECRLDTPSLPPNLSVTIRPMLSMEQLRQAYLESDVYVHFSRIGETFGNTIAEAQAAGCVCVVALDPAWDCAPLEFLAVGRSLAASPATLLRRVDELVDGIERAGRFGPEVVPPLMSVDAYLDRLLGLADGSTRRRTLPSRRAAGGYLASVGNRLAGRRGAVRAPSLEGARAVKNRVVRRRVELV